MMGEGDMEVICGLQAPLGVEGGVLERRGAAL